MILGDSSQLEQQSAGNVASKEATAAAQPPAISLPKGGGAIRGIGEKFAANPVTGTGSMTVPIATSPGRSGFGPQLSLSYDSGAGNGPFGFGWSLSLPSITRKTDKGLPQYLDAEESDIFILSGAEDLVPEFEKDAAGNWVIQNGKHVIHDKTRTVNGVTYRVRRYRPRIEGLFARIERWTNQTNPQDMFWRSISKDNITTWYGKDDNSRIADPADPKHIFSWLICESHDDKGNVIVYRYKAEDSARVDINQVHERNRTPESRSANRYPKYIRYGNHQPYYPTLALDQVWPTPPSVVTSDGSTDWFFEVVFDYNDHDLNAPKPDDASLWEPRQDPFSTYRAGFEVRTYRLCRRVLMFHHFLGEAEVGSNCLVRSTDFEYSYEQNPASARNPVYTFLDKVAQTGYKRDGGGYLKRSLPPVEFRYSQPIVQDSVEAVDAESLENLPVGLDGTTYQWTDLHGEGIPGILTEQDGAWFYKRNLSPINAKPGIDVAHIEAKFAPVEVVAAKPNLALSSGAQFMDLAGDGRSDLVVLDGPMPGLYEHDDAEGWGLFRPFITRLNRAMSDPNLKFVDLNGDGHADVLISEDDAFVWHASLAEEGFGPARRVHQVLDEEKGPSLVFADGTQSIYLADLSGDGLTDLARIRNGEVCYWPNLGYARFGAKITMDNAPHFDNPDQFDQKRIRLADIDGSGTTDIIYLHRDGVRLYFNQSGNSWSKAKNLNVFPHVDDLVSIMPIDLLGNGTACLVYSSPLPGDAPRPMRYVNLMGGQKPHLLIKTVNNLGAETRVEYAPSTKFYLQDKQDGKPWITRLPFPVHVVERVETYDHISHNHFVTRYAYHHGHFDGEEREFRGFGMMEQWDTEAIAALTGDGTLPATTNIDAASHVPPVHTKTWFHTGVYFGREHVSDFFAGLLDAKDKGEYYREPGLTDAQARALLLPDTVLPMALTVEEEREACRALKGSMLRQEVYADDAGPDATPAQIQRARTPYTIAEQNFTIRLEQPRGGNRHAVFFTHAREAITYHYERNPADPRIQHALTLDVDRYGNVLKQAAIGYGRRSADASLPTDDDRAKQTHSLITYTENRLAVDRNTGGAIDTASDYRTPLPAETRTYELTGFTPQNNAARFSFDEWTRNDFALLASAIEIPYEQTADIVSKQKRLIEHVRTLYRKDDLTAILPLGEVEPLALPGESYKLAFTSNLAQQIYVDSGKVTPATLNNTLANEGNYVHSEGDANWWIPSGRTFFDPAADVVDPTNTAAQELNTARQRFYLPRKVADPFGHSTVVEYDGYELLVTNTRDALGNTVVAANDYRVLQPWRMMDPNRNRTEVAFDALGMVVGTAVMGKPEEILGDSLDGFNADLTEAVILDHLANPLTDPHAILGRATTRLIYDLFAYRRSKDQPEPQPAVVYTLVRETHDADLELGQQTRVQYSFSYSDGFGREIQKKIQAEPQKINAVAGPPRWVGSGWTIFNNKGKPVRQYEPFFSNLPPEEGHRFEFGIQAGVSPVLFYDPLERVVATLHPNHTYEKVVFNPWQQITWDVNDTVLGDPRSDPVIAGYVSDYFITQPPAWETWYARRQAGDLGSQEQAAANKAAAHAQTPTVAHFDTLGRPFLTITHNKVVCPNHDLDGMEDSFATRVELDIEGNQREVRDERKLPDADGLPLGALEQRIVMRYDYDLLGNRIHQLSMEAGGRWMLNDVMGKPIRAWDSRDHTVRTEYDPLRRPLRTFVTGADPANPAQELLTERLVYGEQHPQAEQLNLRGQPYLHLDQAGAVTNEAHDFKGNPLRASRRLTNGTQYKQTVDWRAVDADHVALPTNATAKLDLAALEATLAPRLEADPYTSRTTYDALNRPVTLTTPHTPAMPPSAMPPSVIRLGYNEANLLEQVEANLHSATANGQPVWTPFVSNIDYDAKGQRQRIDYGNGVSTFYDYDPLTFRLVHLLTRRNADVFPDDCLQPPPVEWPGCRVQNLHYTYDPVGNISHIRDEAQQAIYFKGKRVEPSNDYTYDALYRLIDATGREHLGQIGGAPIPHSHNDAGRVDLLSANAAGRFAPNDGKAMGTYIEQYVYDAVGNFLEMQHRGSDPSHPGWTRSYGYEEASQLEAGRQSNRLTSTTIGAMTETYSISGDGYDKHGNMVHMPHLPLMRWDYRDQLQATSQQVVNNGGTPETTYYVYDAAGQRVRKVTERQAAAGHEPRRKEERIYLGGFEIYRKYESDGDTIELERETLHIMDDKQRIALVETQTVKDGKLVSDPLPLHRYQFSNHLGSVSLELDGEAQIISYEEHTPYGSTSYQAVRSQTEVPKHYRYTGKERDEESGFYYHGARYYVSWLARWLSADPVGPQDSINLYVYVQNAPINRNDPNGMFSLESFGLGVGKGLAAIVVGVVIVAVVAGTAGAGAVVIAGAAGMTAAGAATTGAVVTGSIYVGASAYGGVQIGKDVYEATTSKEHSWTGEGLPLTDVESSEAAGRAITGVAAIGLMGARARLKSARASDPNTGDKAMAKNLFNKRAEVGKSQVGEATFAQSRSGSRLSDVSESKPMPDNSTIHAEPQVWPSRGGTVVSDQIPCPESCAPKMFLKGTEAVVPKSTTPKAQTGPKGVAKKAASGKLRHSDVSTRTVIPGQEPAPLNIEQLSGDGSKYDDTIASSDYEQMSPDPSIPTSAEIEAQQSLLEPYRHY